MSCSLLGDYNTFSKHLQAPLFLESIAADTFSGDVLIVDRALKARHGDIVVASLDSEMTGRQLHATPPPIRLLPRNPAFQPIIVEGQSVLEIFGVVTNVVRSLNRGGG
ncbi:LexA family protein [Marinobacter sp.]|uniref:LexA family protein n=1 Tax=Marinobacter sp. TaxID=50741 RepID=UPI00384FA3D3